MPNSTYDFAATLWQWSAKESTTWIFVTVPEDISAEFKDTPRPLRRGFGSIQVDVAIGDSRWKTSVFPDSESGCYVLPVKKAVRTAEGISIDDAVNVTLTTLD